MKPATIKNCGNCKFFKEIFVTDSTTADIVYKQGKKKGQCRVRSVEHFPERFSDEWCGEHTIVFLNESQNKTTMLEVKEP